MDTYTGGAAGDEYAQRVAAQMENDKVFRSPYEQYAEHNGKGCAVVGGVGPDEADPEVGPIYRVRFADGVEIQAWPEELHDMDENAARDLARECREVAAAPSMMPSWRIAAALEAAASMLEAL